MATKSGPIDQEKYKSISVRGGSTKSYPCDHNVVWDPDTNRALATAERTGEGGDRVITTGDTKVQEKLEALGYKPNERKILMHNKRPTEKQGAVSAKTVEKRNA